MPKIKNSELKIKTNRWFSICQTSKTLWKKTGLEHNRFMRAMKINSNCYLIISAKSIKIFTASVIKAKQFDKIKITKENNDIKYTGKCEQTILLNKIAGEHFGHEMDRKDFTIQRFTHEWAGYTINNASAILENTERLSRRVKRLHDKEKKEARIRAKEMDTYNLELRKEREAENQKI